MTVFPYSLFEVGHLFLDHNPRTAGDFQPAYNAELWEPSGLALDKDQKSLGANFKHSAFADFVSSPHILISRFPHSFLMLGRCCLLKANHVQYKTSDHARKTTRNGGELPSELDTVGRLGVCQMLQEQCFIVVLNRNANVQPQLRTMRIRIYSSSF